MAVKSISSRDNPHFKQLKLLAASSQARRKAGRTLLDGVHLCDSYLQHVGMPALCATSSSAQTNHEVADILNRCRAGAANCVVLPDGLFEAISQVENGVEILFVIDTPKPITVSAALTQTAVLLDNLQDPGNLGSILRSAAAAGITQVYCGPGTAFCWAPKVLRAAMGAHFVLQILESVNLVELISAAQIPVIATSSHAATSVFENDLRGPVGWLFGNEGQGVSSELQQLATLQLTIPQVSSVESLNVAASAAICFFEQRRQQQAG